MKLSFNGKQTGSVRAGAAVDVSCVAYLEVNDRPVSLRAVAAVSPSMLAVLEELAKPESDGVLYQVRHVGDQVQLFKVGLMARAGSQLDDMIHRRPRTRRAGL